MQVKKHESFHRGFLITIWLGVELMGERGTEPTKYLQYTIVGPTWNTHGTFLYGVYTLDNVIEECRIAINDRIFWETGALLNAMADIREERRKRKRRG